MPRVRMRSEVYGSVCRLLYSCSIIAIKSFKVGSAMGKMLIRLKFLLYSLVYETKTAATFIYQFPAGWTVTLFLAGVLFNS